MVNFTERRIPERAPGPQDFEDDLKKRADNVVRNMFKHTCYHLLLSTPAKLFCRGEKTH